MDSNYLRWEVYVKSKENWANTGSLTTVVGMDQYKYDYGTVLKWHSKLVLGTRIDASFMVPGLGLTVVVVWMEKSLI